MLTNMRSAPQALPRQPIGGIPLAPARRVLRLRGRLQRPAARAAGEGELSHRAFQRPTSGEPAGQVGYDSVQLRVACVLVAELIGEEPATEGCEGLLRSWR